MKTGKAFGFALLLLLACWLCGCTSYEDDYISKYCPGSCTVVKGRFTTANGTKPVKDATLTAIWKDKSYPFGGTIRKKAIARTDDNGHYTLRFLLRDDELVEGYISLEASLPEGRYLDCQGYGALHAPDLSRDTTYLRNYFFPEKAQLVLELTNRQAIASDDRLMTAVTFGTGLGIGRSCGSMLTWSSLGEFRQTVDVAAESPVLLTISKTKAGVITSHTDTLYLSPGERKTHSFVF